MSPRVSKIIFFVNGLICLANAIDVVQRLTNIFSEDLVHAAFIDKWLGWLAILAFGFGWLAFHFAEMLINHNKLWYTKAMLLSVIACEVALLLAPHFAHDVFLKKIAYASVSLMLSGSCLRYSTFEDNRYLLSVKMLSWR